MEIGTIILLNGPSSSGKSTLAKELQAAMNHKQINSSIVSIDDFLEMSTEDVIYEDDVYEISYELCEKVLEDLLEKQYVIVDHVITSERIYQQLLDYLQMHRLIKVQVTCPLQELKRREEERHNRCIGSAEASYEYLYPKQGYDLVVDTFSSILDECVNEVMKLLL